MASGIAGSGFESPRPLHVSWSFITSDVDHRHSLASPCHPEQSAHTQQSCNTHLVLLLQVHLMAAAEVADAAGEVVHTQLLARSSRAGSSRVAAAGVEGQRPRQSL